MKKRWIILLFIVIFILSGCSYTKTPPDAANVMLTDPDTGQLEIGYDLAFRENADKTTYGIVQFQYYRKMYKYAGKYKSEKDKYYTYGRTIYNELYNTENPDDSKHRYFVITDGENSYTIDNIFVDTDTKLCCGIAKIDGPLDQVHAVLEYVVERDYLTIGSVELEINQYRRPNTDNEEVIELFAAPSYDETFLWVDLLDGEVRDGVLLMTDLQTQEVYRVIVTANGEPVAITTDNVVIERSAELPDQASIFTGFRITLPAASFSANAELTLVVEPQ